MTYDCRLDLFGVQFCFLFEVLLFFSVVLFEGLADLYRCDVGEMLHNHFICNGL